MRWQSTFPTYSLKLTNNAKKVLKFVLFHDEVSQRNIKIKGVSYQEIDSACRQCRDLGLLKWGNNAPDPHSMLQACLTSIILKRDGARHCEDCFIVGKKRARTSRSSRASRPRLS